MSQKKKERDERREIYEERGERAVKRYKET